MDGGEAYDVNLSDHGDSCTCPGNVYHGYCKHADCCRALAAAGKLPEPNGYKPDSQHQTPF